MAESFSGPVNPRDDPTGAVGSSKWLNGSAAASANASAVAAVCALIITFQERSTPYKTALFSARCEAIKEYAEASTALQQEVSRLQQSVPIQITSSSGVSTLSDAQVAEISREAYKVYPAWQRYLETSNASAAFWSLETADVLEETRLDGRYAAECYLSWGRRIVGAADAKAANSFRRKAALGAATTCASALKQRGKSEFDWEADHVLRAMTDELRQNFEQFVPGKPHNAFD